MMKWRVRSSITGRFVKKIAGDRHPDTTVREPYRKPQGAADAELRAAAAEVIGSVMYGDDEHRVEIPTTAWRRLSRAMSGVNEA